MTTRWTLSRLASAATLVAVAACGAGADHDPEPLESAAGAGDETAVYQGSGVVIETPEHGPQMAWYLLESYPPQADGLDVVGWDWATVTHESADGTNWGTYLVTATFNGEALELAEEPIPADEAEDEDYAPAEPSESDPPEPSVELSDAELQAIADDLREQFPKLVIANDGDAAEEGYMQIDVVLLTSELEDYAAAHHPAGTYRFTEMMRPVS